MLLPDGSVMLSNVLIVEYMAEDGNIYTESECYDSAGEELGLPKLLELLEFARGKGVAPMLAQLVGFYLLEDADE